MKWLEELTAVFKIPELRKKVLYILFVLGLFRVAATVPVPGIDRAQLQAFLGDSEFFGVLNLFSGGALNNLSIVMLGLGPYITSVIVLQLLTMVFPKLKELHQESGEEGRQKFNQYGRRLTVPLAVMQGYGLIMLFRNQGVLPELALFEIVSIVITVTAGAIFLMWLGEVLSEKGIGNGISILIFAGILAILPVTIRDAVIAGGEEQFPVYLALTALALIIVAAAVVVNEARRHITVSYAKRVRGNKMYGGSTTYLPLSLNPAGVIPIIFALSLTLFPGIAGNIIAGSDSEVLASVGRSLVGFQENTILYATVYFLLVVFFAYFYTSVTFNPDNVAKNLQNQGGFLPGIRPGKPTADRLKYILNRTLMVGSVFLGLIAVVPAVAQGLLADPGLEGLTFFIGGTSALIIVSVVLETVRQTRSQIGMRQYE